MTATFNVTDTRYLTDRDRARMAGSTVRFARGFRESAAHDAVLVSIAGDDMAWVDTAVAPVVYACQSLGIATVESCQGGQRGLDGTPEPAYVAFATHADLIRFAQAVDPACAWPSREGWWTETPKWWMRALPGGRVCVLRFPPEWLPQMAANLLGVGR